MAVLFTKLCMLRLPANRGSLLSMRGRILLEAGPPDDATDRIDREPVPQLTVVAGAPPLPLCRGSFDG
jgi:hypothetical protein